MDRENENYIMLLKLNQSMKLSDPLALIPRYKLKFPVDDSKLKED